MSSTTPDNIVRAALDTLVSVKTRNGVISDKYKDPNILNLECLTKDQQFVDTLLEIYPVMSHTTETCMKMLPVLIMKIGTREDVLTVGNIITEGRIVDMIIKYDVVTVMNTVTKAACVIQVVIRCQARKIAPSVLKGHGLKRRNLLLLNV